MFSLRTLSTATMQRPPIAPLTSVVRFSSSTPAVISTCATQMVPVTRRDNERIASALEELVANDKERRQAEKTSMRLNWLYLALFAPVAGLYVLDKCMRKRFTVTTTVNANHEYSLIDENGKCTLKDPIDKKKFEDAWHAFEDAVIPLRDRAEKSQQK